MDLQTYLTSVSPKLSDVKIAIISRLWQEGTTYPRGWVRSSELLRITNQKYFDRRVRELRDENGCDIETGTLGGEHAYRLNSTEIAISNPRSYLTASQKNDLFRQGRYACSVCGRVFGVSEKGLQADHRIPLKRGGTHSPNNWQPLCVECNVGKRSACAGCEMDCLACPWAFPEEFQHRFFIKLSNDVGLALEDYSQKSGITKNQAVENIIKNFLR
jgi:rubredoxin